MIPDLAGTEIWLGRSLKQIEPLIRKDHRGPDHELFLVKCAPIQLALIDISANAISSRFLVPSTMTNPSAVHGDRMAASTTRCGEDAPWARAQFCLRELMSGAARALWLFISNGGGFF